MQAAAIKIHHLLEKLEQEVRAGKAELDAKVKVLAEDRTAIALLEERSHAALKALYEKGLEKPLTTDEDGPAQLLPFFVDALEEVVHGVGPMAQVEARVLSSAALTSFFSHLHLCDPEPISTSCWSPWTASAILLLLKL